MQGKVRSSISFKTFVLDLFKAKNSGVRLRTPGKPKSPLFPPETPPQLPQRLDEETSGITLERPTKKGISKVDI